MLCQRCERTLQTGDGVRCSYCESKHRSKCVTDTSKAFSGSGDKEHQWKCVLCQAIAAGTQAEIPQDDYLLNIITALSKKFEVVNKIQLPRLNSELSHIKFISDHISKQNDEILRKITDYEKRNSQEKRPSAHGYRKRNLNLTHKCVRVNKCVENNDLNMPMMPSEKSIRHRMRRRSYAYLLNRMLHILNKKLQQRRVSSRKSSMRAAGLDI